MAQLGPSLFFYFIFPPPKLKLVLLGLNALSFQFHFAEWINLTSLCMSTTRLECVVASYLLGLSSNKVDCHRILGPHTMLHDRKYTLEDDKTLVCCRISLFFEDQIRIFCIKLTETRVKCEREKCKFRIAGQEHFNLCKQFLSTKNGKKQTT